MHELTRRDLIAGGTAALGSLALPGLIASPARAQANELIANTYGGFWETGHRQAVAAVLEQKYGAKVTLVSILANEIVVRTKAAAGGKPPVDIALTDDGPFLNAVKEQVFQALPADKITNAAKLYPQYKPKNAYGLPVSASVIGIAYNAKKLKVAPASWEDLWNPAYKGRLGFATPASTLGTVTLLSLARLKGGDESKIEPGFEAVKSLLPSTGSIAATPANLQTLLERGEVDIAPTWHANALVLKSKGTGIEFVFPREGGIFGLAWLSITKGANTELATAYINQALSPDAQKLLASPGFFLGPTIQGVEVAPDYRHIIPASPEVMKKLIQVDWSTINPVRPEWINRWNREIKV
jgi:putative spermidine/putrescine transport system substrate-binding protein